MSQPLSTDLLAKIQEQIERTQHLIGFLPSNALTWQPNMERPWSAQQLLVHITTCLAGFCAVLYAARPERLGHFPELRRLPRLENPDAAAIGERIRLYGERIREGFVALDDADLGKIVPTVFVPNGESILTLLLGNLEHLLNHKHQLFLYLRLMAVEVTSADLYRFRDTITPK